MFFNRDKHPDNVQKGKEDKEDMVKDVQESPKVKLKMIWVDGFKGTDKDMKCKGSQYELNKEFTYDGKLDLCNSGFHACKKFEDVFNYYDLDGQNRFFRIKAFVPEDYDKNFGGIVIDPAGYYNADTKFVTSHIKFISELTFDDLKNYIVKLYPMIENENEYHNCLSNYDIFAKNKFIKKMMELGYSESFAMIISDSSKYYMNLLNYAKAFKDENISKDLSIYMLIKRIEQLQ